MEKFNKLNTNAKGIELVVGGFIIAMGVAA